MSKIIRVFPRKTSATPDDCFAFVGEPPETVSALQGMEGVEVHISVTFSYDIPEANRLAELWSKVAPVKIGGPALGDRGSDFVPGKYVKPGYVITSRGCPNDCWFCDVHKREGNIRELPIAQGSNLLDSNILACSLPHVQRVFNMLKLSESPVELTGGLEAKRLSWQHVDMLWDLRPSSMFFAYDTPDDLDPLISAGIKLRFANFTRQHLRCYVLIGWPKDTIAQAKKRLIETWRAGFMPMAMLWKNKRGDEDREWRKFQRLWARPALTKRQMQNIYHNAVYGENK